MAKSSEARELNEYFKEHSMYDFLKVIKRFYPGLFKCFGSCDKDPRKQNRIKYTTGIILTMLFFKYVCSIVSMHSMADKFNVGTVIENLLNLSGETGLQNIPHYQTINDFLARLSPVFLEEMRCNIITHLIRTNQFYSYRLDKQYWLILIDGTGIYGGSRKIHSKCLFRVHNKKQADEYTTYHIQVLEAKLLLFGINIPFSIMSEYIENTPEDEKSDKKMSDEKYKQDCERKAFTRLAKRIKEKFPHMPICIVADALYNTEPVIATCEKYRWKYIFRFKDGTIQSIAEEVQGLADEMEAGVPNELEPVRDVAYLKDIEYGGHKVTYLRATDRKIVVERKETRGQKKTKKDPAPIKFQWITNLDLSPRFAVKVALAGRARWKIENEGFNRQKNWVGNMTHLCSWNEQAIKNHYCMMQIADIFRMLFEYVNITSKKIKRTFEQIADDLYTAFSRANLFAEEAKGKYKTVLEKLVFG